MDAVTSLLVSIVPRSPGRTCDVRRATLREFVPHHLCLFCSAPVFNIKLTFFWIL